MSDYDAMLARILSKPARAHTGKEMMRLRVLRVAYHLEDGLGPNGLLGPYSEEQADMVHDLLHDLHFVANWLDAQPDASEHWEQINTMPDTPCGYGDPEYTLTIGMDDEVLYIEDEGEYLTAHLPDGYALCRKVEGTP